MKKLKNCFKFGTFAGDWTEWKNEAKRIQKLSGKELLKFSKSLVKLLKLLKNKLNLMPFIGRLFCWSDFSYQKKHESGNLFAYSIISPNDN